MGNLNNNNSDIMEVKNEEENNEDIEYLKFDTDHTKVDKFLKKNSVNYSKCRGIYGKKIFSMPHLFFKFFLKIETIYKNVANKHKRRK